MPKQRKARAGAIVRSGHTLTVYDDYSTPENAARLDALHEELGIRVVHISEHVDHPSPNYRWVLRTAQREALEQNRDLVIIESDVLVQPETIDKLGEWRKANGERPIGMVAAVTVNDEGVVNFPYEYARKIQPDGPCKKRFSFCCTLLTQELLRAYNFELLDPEKNWYDVHISHMSVKLGFENILQV